MIVESKLSGIPIVTIISRMNDVLVGTMGNAD